MYSIAEALTIVYLLWIAMIVILVIIVAIFGWFK